MKVVVIGASGHVGSYLVKELVKDGHEVVAIMRGNRVPYGYDEGVWNKVIVENLSREELYQTDFIEKVNADVVCDLIAFDLDGVKKIVSKINNNAFYVQIGSIWVYENKEYLPVDENHPKNAIQNYGRQKGLIEKFLLSKVNKGELKATVIHPGHVSGKEWQPVNPQGNLDFDVFKKIKNGEKIFLPYNGLSTIQHVHSYDLARIIIACINKQEISNGQVFIAVARKAMTLRAITEKMFDYFDKKSNIEYLEWQDFKRVVGDENAAVTLDHISHSPCCTPNKVEKLLGVSMKYSIMDIYYEYIEEQIKLKKL
ncbi:MAG: NAD-dependent epimerase/dehydratase family protein [Clostridia bacterium]|nr:NAD-dependent epimerase/dehydratase family protein [Clostridia bacterium]